MRPRERDPSEVFLRYRVVDHDRIGESRGDIRFRPRRVEANRLHFRGMSREYGELLASAPVPDLHFTRFLPFPPVSRRRLRARMGQVVMPSASDIPLWGSDSRPTLPRIGLSYGSKLCR